MPQALTIRINPAIAGEAVTGAYVESLETVELSMALEAQNLVGSGFDNAVRHAAEAIGAEVLFNIPAPSSLPFQRAALVKMQDDDAELMLVTLDAQGADMKVVKETPETAHLFRLGEAWTAVVSQFRKLGSGPVHFGEMADKWRKYARKSAKDGLKPVQAE